MVLRKVDFVAQTSHGAERRRGQRRVGVGRRVLRDRRVAERRVESIPASFERRTNPDRRIGQRRLETRRKLPDRRASSLSRDLQESSAPV